MENKKKRVVAKEAVVKKPQVADKAKATPTPLIVLACLSFLAFGLLWIFSDINANIAAADNSSYNAPVHRNTIKAPINRSNDPLVTIPKR
jgi:hypothetical protein